MSNNIKKSIILLLIAAMTCVYVYADEDSLPTDTFFTQNVQLNSIVYTNMGIILVYNSGKKMREAYLPSRFLNDGHVKIVPINEPGVTMQANVFYRNGKPYKVKIYTSPTQQGPGYVVRTNITKAMKEKFDNTEELEFYVR